jgi:hypothetical protein
MTRLADQHLAIELLRIGQPPGLVMLESDLHRLLDHRWGHIRFCWLDIMDLTSTIGKTPAQNLWRNEYDRSDLQPGAILHREIRGF